MSDDSEFRCDTYTTAVPIDSPGYRCSVRVVHLPTGLVASCDDTKSVVVNRERALAEVRARVRQRAIEEGVTPVTIKYGVQPVDGSDVHFCIGRKDAEGFAARSGGDVVYRIGEGSWQRAAGKVVVDRADLAALLSAVRAFHADAVGVDAVMLEAQRGIVDRLERAIGEAGSTP